MSTALVVPVPAETLLDDLMRTHTVTIPIFIRRRMMCIGCPVVRLHDLREACREHGVPLDEFLAEVNGVIATGRRPDRQTRARHPGKLGAPGPVVGK